MRPISPLLSVDRDANIKVEDTDESEQLLQSRSAMLVKCKDTIIDLSSQLDNHKKEADELANKCIKYEEEIKTMQLTLQKKDNKIKSLSTQLDELKQEREVSIKNATGEMLVCNGSPEP